VCINIYIDLFCCSLFLCFSLKHAQTLRKHRLYAGLRLSLSLLTFSRKETLEGIPTLQLDAAPLHDHLLLPRGTKLQWDASESHCVTCSYCALPCTGRNNCPSSARVQLLSSSGIQTSLKVWLAVPNLQIAAAPLHEDLPLPRGPSLHSDGLGSQRVPYKWCALPCTGCNNRPSLPQVWVLPIRG